MHPDFQAEMAALCERYARTLPDKIDALARAVEAMRTARGGASESREAQVLAHKLRGAAGSYGQPVIGEAAGRIEDAVAALAEGGGSASEAEWKALRTAVESIEALGRALPSQRTGGGA